VNFTIRDIDGDDVDIIPNREDGTVEVEETLTEACEEGAVVYTTYTASTARKFAMRLLQAAEEVDPS
jgi:hypothetical protein